MYIRVVEPSSQCPEVGPFYPASPSRAVQLGMVRSSNIIQDPNWVLIGGLFGGAVAVMIGMVIALVSLYNNVLIVVYSSVEMALHASLLSY